MAQYHRQTPLDPQKGYENQKTTTKTGWGRAGIILWAGMAVLTCLESTLHLFLKDMLSCTSKVPRSTARVSSRKYFIPGCVGRGLDLGLRIRPAAASGNPGLGPLGIAQKSGFFQTPFFCGFLKK